MSLVAPFPLPPDAVLRSVDVGSGPLAVVDLPPRGGETGPPVLLVPGFTGSKEDFRLVLEPLARSGRRVLAYDQRGQHQSPGPDDPAAYTTEALAHDLLGLLDALDLGPIDLVGHSFGGLVGRAAVLARPRAARSLVLLASGPAALGGARAEGMALMRPVLEQGGLEALADAAEALAAADPRRAGQPAEVIAFLRTRMLATNPTCLVASGDALLAEPDRVEDLRRTGVPVLVLHGDGDDAWTPDEQAEMARRLGAAHVVLPGALHSPAVETPEATVEALQGFWRSLG